MDPVIPNLGLGHPYCLQKEDGSYPQDVTANSGGDEDAEMWGEGGSCIFRPIKETWAVTHNQNVMIWVGADEMHYQRRNEVPAGVTHFYRILYKVNGAVPVDWTMDWYHSIMDHNAKEPTKILINYQKTNGTQFIKSWKGSIILESIAPGVTSFTMRNHINAARTNLDDMKLTIHQFTDKLRTGEPNWGAINIKP